MYVGASIYILVSTVTYSPSKKLWVCIYIQKEVFTVDVERQEFKYNSVYKEIRTLDQLK